LETPPPTVILCIDEVALLKDDSEIMDRIEKIGVIGRALGVFLILAMQRPDADVLDGKLKQCLTVRVSFRQPDEINSRIALGNGEAAKINIADKGMAVAFHEKLELVRAPMLSFKEARELLEPLKQGSSAPVKATPIRKPKKNRDNVVPLVKPDDGEEDDGDGFIQ
jgi:S-DNA-T family DNA segregation ATPase FtsK/SpoIIIE